MIKIKKLIILFIFILLFIPGCINYTELNDIGIVNMIGINKIDKNYEVTINMIIPTNDNKNNTKSFKVKAPSLDLCFNNLYEKSLRKISLSHLDLLLLSPTLEKKDYDEVINLFLNRSDSRNTFSTVILKNYKDINNLNLIPEDINSLLKVNNKEFGITQTKQFDEVVKEILELKESFIPLIEINKDINILGYMGIYNIDKTLNKKESLALGFITNNINNTYILNKDNDINFKVNSNITRIKINKNNIKIIINSNISILSNGNNIKDTKKLENIYKEELTNMLDNYIKNNSHKYFYNLVEKYENSFYKNNKLKKLNFIYEINPRIDEISDTLGGVFVEKE